MDDSSFFSLSSSDQWMFHPNYVRIFSFMRGWISGFGSWPVYDFHTLKWLIHPSVLTNNIHFPWQEVTQPWHSLTIVTHSVFISNVPLLLWEKDHFTLLSRGLNAKSRRSRRNDTFSRHNDDGKHNVTIILYLYQPGKPIRRKRTMGTILMSRLESATERASVDFSLFGRNQGTINQQADNAEKTTLQEKTWLIMDRKPTERFDVLDFVLGHWPACLGSDSGLDLPLKKINVRSSIENHCVATDYPLKWMYSMFFCLSDIVRPVIMSPFIGGHFF